MGSKKNTLHKFKNGLQLPILGTPIQSINGKPKISKVALLGQDYVGMRPRMLINEGDSVLRGQPLMEDRKNPGVIFTSPGQGIVSAVNRGERRSFKSLVIDLKEDPTPGEITYKTFSKKQPEDLTAQDIRSLMLETGLWTSMRTRPFGKVPAPNSVPHALFITAIDTHPLAPSPEKIIEDESDSFAIGVKALVKLADGQPIYLCTESDLKLSDISSTDVEVHRFEGPHPVGNPGFHIHILNPAERDRVAWHIGYQDTAALGHLLSTGKLKMERTIAIGGPGAKDPRLITARLGASLSDALRGESKDGEIRVISGSVFSGHDATQKDTCYLGRYNNQVTLLEENRKREFLGWMAPGLNSFSSTKLFLSSLTSGTLFDIDTSANGGLRAMIPSHAYEAVMPFDLMPNFLLKSLLSGDLERAEALGCLELAEEDLATCTFVCASKIDYGAALRTVLNQIEKEG